MFVRFLLVGGSGFVIDAGITWLLLASGAAAWLARIPAILAAMAFTWLANRHFTYALTTARSASEATRYFLMAAFMAGLNYAVYLLLVQAGLAAVPAVALATGLQAGLSFFAYRDIVFKKVP